MIKETKNTLIFALISFVIVVVLITANVMNGEFYV